MDINELKQHINKKSRLIGVDMGSKRVGLSISDENRKIATPFKTINYENIQLLITEIDKPTLLEPISTPISLDFLFMCCFSSLMFIIL